jgi:hypothetical protein
MLYQTNWCRLAVKQLLNSPLRMELSPLSSLSYCLSSPPLDSQRKISLTSPSFTLSALIQLKSRFISGPCRVAKVAISSCTALFQMACHERSSLTASMARLLILLTPRETQEQPPVIQLRSLSLSLNSQLSLSADGRNHLLGVLSNERVPS